jgi:hypothetical protein
MCSARPLLLSAQPVHLTQLMGPHRTREGLSCEVRQIKTTPEASAEFIRQDTGDRGGGFLESSRLQHGWTRIDATSSRRV